MNKPEKTYKQELFKWVQYLHPIFFNKETQSIEADVKDIMVERVTELARSTIVEVRLEHPKGGYISMSHELGNKKIEQSENDLIVHWKEKLWAEVYRSVILNGIKAINKPIEVYGT